MRIGLVNEGTYPVATGGVSTWCHQLVSGLTEHEWHLVAVTGDRPALAWTLPPQVGSTTLVPMWGPAPSLPLFRPVRSARRRHAVAAALGDLWRVALPGEPEVGARPDRGRLELAAAALRTLAAPGDAPLAAVLAVDGSAPAILRAWREHRAARLALPPLSVADAAQAAALVDRALALVDVPWPEVDLVHAAANGPAALVGLARSWRDGVPLLLTEHGVYLRERYLALGDLDLPWPVRYVVLAALRTICSLAYEHASWILPVSRFNARWERQLGADPARTVTIHNGVDQATYPAIADEPEVPTISFVGRIDPLKDLETLVAAFAIVRRSVPDARLRVFGPCPAGNERYQRRVRDRAAALGLGAELSWEGPVDGAVPAIAAGHVVALSSISEGLPFTVIESMFSGRATVSTDVGGVEELVGRDGVAGALVPPRDPEAMAAALVALLVDGDRRRAVGRAARARAVELFTLERCLDAYRRQYDATGPETGGSSIDLTGGEPPADSVVESVPAVDGWRPEPVGVT